MTVLSSLVLALAVQAASAPTRPAPRSIRMEPAVVVDATGFEKPIAAATLFVPHGWKAAGGVEWGAEYACTNGNVFRWSVVGQFARIPREGGGDGAGRSPDA